MRLLLLITIAVLELLVAGLVFDGSTGPTAPSEQPQRRPRKLTPAA
jgi:hypothetical protein